MRICIIFVFLFKLSIFPQQEPNKSPLFLADKTVYKLDDNNNSLPVWIAASDTVIDAVNLEIPTIISWDGRVKTIGYTIDSFSKDVSVNRTGRLFKINFKDEDISDLDSGKYSAVMLISGAGIQTVKETLSFEFIPSKGAFAWIEEALSWIQNNFFLLLLNLFEVILLFLLLLLTFEQPDRQP